MVGKQQFPDKHSVWINTTPRSCSLTTPPSAHSHKDTRLGWGVGRWLSFALGNVFFFPSLSLCTQYYKHDNRVRRSPLRWEGQKIDTPISETSCLMGVFSSRRSCRAVFGPLLPFKTFCVSFSPVVSSLWHECSLVFAAFRLFHKGGTELTVAKTKFVRLILVLLFLCQLK